MSFMKTLIILPAIFISFSSLAVVIRPSLNLGDCDCKNSNFEVLKAVGDASEDHFGNEKLKEEVAIRGEDTRQLSKEFNAAMPFGCNYDGSDKVFATATLIGESKVATVLHNILEYQAECKELSDISKCFVYDGKKKIRIKSWSDDPIKLCQSNMKDQIVIADLEDTIKDRRPFEAACIDFIDPSKIEEVITVGAKASNFSKPNLGVESISGNGTFYGIDKSGMIKFENDLGAGNSGGSVIAKINGKRYLIGIIRGDSYDGPYKSRFEKGKPMDGLPGDKNNNFGQAFPIFSESNIPCEEIPHHSS